MDDVAQRFCEWIDGRKLCGTPLLRTANNHWLASLRGASANVELATLAGGKHAAILRVTHEGTQAPSFCTRFVLEDEPFARRLVHEMATVAEATVRRGATLVRVCHAPGESVDAFVDALAEQAAKLAVPYEFQAASIIQDLAHTDVTAVMLTPQAEALRTLARNPLAPHDHEQDVVTTFVIPPAALARHDATTALTLLTEVLYEVDTIACRPVCQRSLRALPGHGHVLIIHITYCDRCVRMGYRVYGDDVVRARGAVTKARLDLRDVHDLLSTLALDGIDASKLDALALITPGVVNFCSMNLPSLGLRDVDLAETLSERYGIPVFLDNSANAAAMGCYLLQPDCHSLTLYRHQIGHKNGGQGSVIDGKLVKGHSGMAGEPKFYQRMFCYEGGYASAVWSAQGLAAITRNVLLATIGTISPDVACVAVNALDDLDVVRCGLERALPQYCIPELVRVSDYRDCMYLGEVALCLERLA